MRAKILATACFAWLGLSSIEAKADYLVTTPTIQAPNTLLQMIKSGTLGGGLLPWSNLVDTTGTPIGTAGNPLSFNCITGCGGGSGGGTSSNFSSAFPAAGTAIGVSNGTNMVPITLGQAVSSGSLPVVLPAAQITALTPPAALTNFSLETGGNLASINTKTPALGQALAAASVPVVFTAAQLTTLTPLSSVTVTQPTGTNLHMVCDSGCSSSSSPSFGSAFPATGTPIGMSQGGNLTAFTGTAGNLNINIAAGSIANTSFGATQATASALNATVVGLGTAGTPSGGVLSVQGVSGGTPQPVAVASAAAVDCWSVTGGCKADGPATLPATTTPVTDMAIQKAIANALNSLLTAQTTPLNNSSVPINVSTATTTQLVALSGSTAIYVTSFDVIAGGTGNITFEYGTGTACATGTTALTGAYPLVAQAGISKGDGIGTVLKVPAGNALCVLTSAGVQMSGSVSYQQF